MTTTSRRSTTATAATTRSRSITGFMAATLTAAVAAAGALPACTEEPINEVEVTASIGRQVEQMVRTTGRSTGFMVAEDGTLSRAIGGTSSSVDGVVAPMNTMMSTMATGGMPAPMMRALVGRRLSQQLSLAPAMPSMMTAEEQFDEIAAELRQLLDERLFVPANFESKDGGTAVYLLRPDPTCRPLPTEEDPPGTIPPVDADCAADLEKIAVRLSLTKDGDGGRVTVLVGPQRLELVAFVVHSDLLALEIDLGKAKAAADYISRELGESAPMPMDAYARLAGKVRVSVTKVGDQKVTAALALIEALDIATGPDAADPVEIRSAAANPLVAVTGDGFTKTATIELGLGLTEVVTAWDPMGTGAVNRDMKLSFGGYHGRFTVDENAKRIDITDAGFGQTRLLVRNIPILDVNLNPNSQRRFSGSVTVNADDTPHIEIRPEIDLTLAFDYAQVASELSTPPDPSTLHDTYGVLLAAPGGTAVLDGVAESATFGGGIKMVTGSLTFSVFGPPAQTVTVPEGRCLTSVSPVPDGAHPFLGALQVVDCP